jgi:hypothetical protein
MYGVIGTHLYASAALNAFSGVDDCLVAQDDDRVGLAYLGTGAAPDAHRLLDRKEGVTRGPHAAPPQGDKQRDDYPKADFIFHF